MQRILFGSLAFVIGVALIASTAVSQPPGGKDGKDGKGGDKGGPPKFELGQIFPPPLEAELNLTPSQQKELDALRTELKAKLEKLLTAEQKKTIENFRPRGGMGGDKGGPPGGDKGGKGGPPGGDKGGKGGDKGGKGGELPDRPPVEKKGGSAE